MTKAMPEIVAQGELYGENFSFFADVKMPEDGILRQHFYDELRTGLEDKGIEMRPQYGFSDNRVRFFFASAADREGLHDVRADQDFDYRVLKRQEGIILPRKVYTCKGPRGAITNVDSVSAEPRLPAVSGSSGGVQAKI